MSDPIGEAQSEVLQWSHVIGDIQGGLVEAARQAAPHLTELRERLGRDGAEEWAEAQGLDPRSFVFWSYAAKATDEELVDSIGRLATWLCDREAIVIAQRKETLAEKLNRLHAEAMEHRRAVFSRTRDAGEIIAEITAELGPEKTQQWLAENFTGTAQEAGEYALVASLTPETAEQLHRLHGEKLQEAMHELFRSA